ncbi:metallophosphoesterase [Hymenobacter convexus]|uniref:metallophosphoesterase n=1 Tax=Hymenobacter sp. CA1UV-4 TaxID=3063782 RepID=UPI002712B719|nr:metallophosphoesterase [Hymenobacter sp. CA1UV-4]MDO7852576.1 metallophosphoesterase [Hymenobacter sp. CA1UV-4]
MFDGIACLKQHLLFHSVGKSRRSFIKYGLALTAGTVATDAFWIEKHFFEINEFHLRAATAQAPSIKLVQLSDLHLQTIDSQIFRLSQKINELNPDLLAITGDALDKTDNILLLDDFLRLINPSIQKVAILGNWEYWGKIDLIQLNNIYKQYNCELLINQTKQYSFAGKTIAITGIDDFVGGNSNFGLATEKIQPSDYHVVLNHCPEYSAHIAAAANEALPIDCILSGHTHGGQITLLGYAPFLPPGSGKFLKGWYEFDNCRLYVSKGMGTSMIPARFGARAEIAVFHFPV